MDTQLDGLKWIVRALAQPAHIQRKLFPSFTFPADEMILEFEQFFDPASSRYTDVWSGTLYLSLRALDEALRALSDSNDEESWLEDDGLDRPKWSEIRRLAREVIRVSGWAGDEPPPSREIEC